MNKNIRVIEILKRSLALGLVSFAVSLGDVAVNRCIGWWYEPEIPNELLEKDL